MRSKFAAPVLCLMTVLSAACAQGASQDLTLVAQTSLQAAAVAAQTYYQTNLSYSGFSADKAKQLDPAIKWTEAGPAAAGEISIRGDTATGMVLVTKAGSGETLCLGVTTSGQSMGQVDAQTPADCTGGWP